MIIVVQKPPHNYVGQTIGDIEHDQKKNEKKVFRERGEISGASRQMMALELCTLSVCGILASAWKDSHPLLRTIGRKKTHIFEFGIAWSPPEFFNNTTAIIIPLLHPRDTFRAIGNGHVGLKINPFWGPETLPFAIGRCRKAIQKQDISNFRKSVTF